MAKDQILENLTLIEMVLHPFFNTIQFYNDCVNSACLISSLSASPRKWSNTLSVSNHFVGLALKGLVSVSPTQRLLFAETDLEPSKTSKIKSFEKIAND